MVHLTLISKKEIFSGETYCFNGHEIICESWTERGKNGSNVAAQFIGKVDGQPFKGSITDLKKKVGANVLSKSDKGTPTEIFETYLSNMRKIVGLPSYYLTAINKLECTIEEERQKEKEQKALAEKDAAAKLLGYASYEEFMKAQKPKAKGKK